MRLFILATAIAGALAGPALADLQRYAVSFGSRDLGTLEFSEQPGRNRLLITLDNAPLGIKNGTVQAVSVAVGDSVEHQAQNRGSETRDIALVRLAGVVTSVTVTPQSEMTEMSATAKVPPGVIFPAEVFAAFATASTCPAPMAMYDGRRVVQIATLAMDQDGDAVTCDMAYRVVMGPGYVAPFYFKSFDLQLGYRAQQLARVTMGAGGFAVTLMRQ